MAELFGFCDERFSEVRDTLAASIDSGEDWFYGLGLWCESPLAGGVWHISLD